MTEHSRGPAPSDDVLVSVSITTFNHRPYIEDAVNGALSQRTPFSYEIIVGDDCSTDGTREILLEMNERLGGRLRLVLPERNLGDGGKPMFARTLEVARGRYIAVLDGDDYWTDPAKLTKQVEFLEAHPECSMCFHDVLQVTDDGSRPPHRRNASTPAKFTGIEDVLKGCYVGACTPMFRREVVCPLPDWYFKMEFGDWPLYLIAAELGPIGYIDEVMAVYRIHSGGMWNHLDSVRKYEQMLRFYQQIHEVTGGRYIEQCRPIEAKWHYKLALALSEEDQRRAALREGLTALRLCPVGGEIDRIRMLREFARHCYRGVLGGRASRN